MDEVWEPKVCPRCGEAVVEGPEAWIEIKDEGSKTGFRTRGYSCRKCNLTVWPYFVTVKEEDELLQVMDVAWWELTEDQRAGLQKEPSTVPADVLTALFGNVDEGFKDLLGKQIVGWKIIDAEIRGQMVDIKFEHITSKEIKKIRDAMDNYKKVGLPVLLARAIARPPEKPDNSGSGHG